MLVVVAPGQGSQRPGFLQPWSEHPPAAALLRSYGDLLGIDLTRLGARGDAEEIRDTAVAQPLLVAAGLTAATLLLGGREEDTPFADVLGGHSVGELTAAALAGAMTDQDALRLAAARGAAMAEAATMTAAGMTAVVGIDVETVRATSAALGLAVATVNGPGQVVVAGPTDALAALAADPPRGARLVPLEVSGAFHTELMSPAAAEVRRTAAALEVADPARPLVSCLDGAVVTSGRDLTERLVAQVVRPVRWDLCQHTFARLGVTGMLELSPAGTLIALCRRVLPHVERFALRGPDDLPAARTFASRHAKRRRGA